jgi:hypothetical protein
MATYGLKIFDFGLARIETGDTAFQDLIRA